MIIPFILDIEPGIKARYACEFYNLGIFAIENNFPFIVQEAYFQSDAVKTFCERNDPHFFSKLKNRQVYLISDQMMEEMQSEKGSTSDACVFLHRERYAPLEAFLQKIFEKIGVRSIKAILSFRKYPTLTHILEILGLQAIYYDAGCFREDAYEATVYIDFKGQMSDTEAQARYVNFLEEKEKRVYPLFSRKEILSLMLKSENLGYLGLYDKEPEYEIGIAVQWTYFYQKLINSISNNLDTIDKVKRCYTENEILVRNHPTDVSGADYKRVSKNIDYSRYSLEFICQCKRVASETSNVSFEAMVWNRTAYCLGECQYSFMTKSDLSDKTLDAGSLDFINFISFAFYIPLRLLTDHDYLVWRLSRPSEMEIFNRHVAYYLSLKKIPEEALQIQGEARLAAFLKAQGVDSQCDLSIPSLRFSAEFPGHLRKQVEEKDAKVYELHRALEGYQASDKEKTDKIFELNAALEGYQTSDMQKADKIVELNAALEGHQASDKEKTNKIYELNAALEGYQKSDMQKCTELEAKAKYIVELEESLHWHVGVVGRLNEALAYAQKVEGELDAALERFKQECSEGHRKISEMENSVSWKITKFLRH